MVSPNMQNYSNKITIGILSALLTICAVLTGCGPEDHSPTITCSNFGIENVRRNIVLRVGVDVTRLPLSGVSGETVKLLKLPLRTPVAGTVIYGGQRILFQPTLPLTDSTEYELSILAGIADASGRALNTLTQEFWTGRVLQVYYIDYLNGLDTRTNEIGSVAIYFSEGIDSTLLIFGEGYVTVYEDFTYIPQTFYTTYYAANAKAVLIFYTPLQTGKQYFMTVGSNICSQSDRQRLDGDRDGSEWDMENFRANFRYEVDQIYGVIVADSSTTAREYFEPKNRCFLNEF
jgi:hypothetical protein